MIIERIKKKIEPDMCVVPQTTPVIYFGNYDMAKACTISLNPSNLEFVDKSNKLLDDTNSERLCSRKKMNKIDSDELSYDDAETVLKHCTDYFKSKPYKSWFDPFNYFIKCYGDYSYYEDTCVHLDLVQWATYKKWNEIPISIKQKHLANDLPVLKYLLKKDFEVMFLNGKTVVKNVCDCLSINLKEKITTFKNRPLIVYHGEYNKIKVVGWNIYLQSAAGGGYKDKSILCDLTKPLPRLKARGFPFVG
jgi:hypothetical protein